jgi:ligand-binding sensor domain-containing protein/two-component sensor histidine kinase
VRAELELGRRRGRPRPLARPACAHTRWLACLALALPPAASFGEQLSFRHYGPADGLAGSIVVAIHQDRHGYLWFGATDSLARFDGQRFTVYDQRDGMSAPRVNAIAEDGQGRLWMGTNVGLLRLAEDAPTPVLAGAATGRRAKFVARRVGEPDNSNQVLDMAFAPDGTLSCLTSLGLYRGDPERAYFAPVVGLPAASGPPTRTAALLLDSQERLWVAADKGIALVEAGRTTEWKAPDLVTRHNVRALVETPRGRILAANDVRLFEYRPPPRGERRGSWSPLPLALAPQQEIRAVRAARDGALWIGTTHGLVRYQAGEQALYTTANGLRSDFVRALYLDREDHLWIGTQGGLARLRGTRAASYTLADGLPAAHVERIVEARDGRIYVRTLLGGFAEIVGRRAVVVPGSQRPWLGRDVNDLMAVQVLQDRRGDWWVMTRTRIGRFRGPALQFENGELFGAAHGIPAGTRFSGSMNGIHEDEGGRIWLASQHGLFRSEPPGRGPPLFTLLPLVFTDSDEVEDLVADRSGSLWFTTHRDLARVADGRIERLLPTGWRPVDRPRFPFVDSRGRLWIGLRHRGLYVTANPAAAEPSFTHYSAEQGLASDNVNALAEDGRGRIYVGTSRGVDLLDPERGRIRAVAGHAELAGEYVSDVITDQKGRLWVATNAGLTRLDQAVEPGDAAAPPVLFTKIHVAGEELRLPERGAREVPELRLGHASHNLLIEYVAVSVRSDRPLRYQYRLADVDSEWSAASEQRAVNFARLAPGDYRFLVRAVAPDGQPGPPPAVLAFRIAPPFWRRGWFLAAAALALAAAVEGLHRLRLRRRLELEAIRKRIATDLHDDIGSNLSRIAILSEVAGRDLARGDPTVKQRLAQIGSVSRELVDSMGDIVWAVNPARDRLRDLVRRMRHFADDVLSARDIALSFRAPQDGHAALAADTRRQLYLVFKEAVNNLARHSGARNAGIDLSVSDGWLSLRVADDGRGFDVQRFETESADGNGVRTMRRRAQELGGSVEITSAPGAGTTVELRVPTHSSWTRGLRARTARLLGTPWKERG